MRFFKTESSDNIITRLDAAEVNVSSGEEITETEYKCMRVGVDVFINKKNPLNITAEDWGAEKAGEVS